LFQWRRDWRVRALAVAWPKAVLSKMTQVGVLGLRVAAKVLSWAVVYSE